MPIDWTQMMSLFSRQGMGGTPGGYEGSPNQPSVMAPQGATGGQPTSAAPFSMGGGGGDKPIFMTPESDYWSQPSVGGMPLHRFATIAGMAANAIAPKSVGGRLGKSAAGMASEYGKVALQGEQRTREEMMKAAVKATQERQKRLELSGLLSRLQPQSGGFRIGEGLPEAPGAGPSAFGVAPVTTSLRGEETPGSLRPLTGPDVAELFSYAPSNEAAKAIADYYTNTGQLPSQEGLQTENMFKMLGDPRMQALTGLAGAPATGTPTGGAQPLTPMGPGTASPLELDGLNFSKSGPQFAFKPRGVDESLKDPFLRETRAMGFDPRGRLTPEQVQQAERSLTQRKSSQELEQFTKQQEISHSFPAQATSAELRTQAKEEQGITQLERLKSFYSPDLVGPVAGRFLAQRVKYGYDLTGKPVSKTDANFMALTKAIGNAVIQAISGAAVSAQEAERLMGQIPTELNPPATWEARYQQSLLNIKELNARVKQKMQGGGVPPSPGGRTLSPQEEADAYLGGR